MENGVNGFICGRGQETLLNGIRKMMSLNDAELQRMGRVSQKMAIEYFSAKEYVEKIEKYYLEMLGKGLHM